MSFMLLNRRLSSVIVLFKRSAVYNQSKTDLSSQMKSFNESKQYKMTLQLFDENKTNDNVTCSRSTLFHVLKASALLKDLTFSSHIQQLISTKFNHDPYLAASLIHLYMQCGDFHRGELLFHSLKRKTEGAYGAMMKGCIKNNQAKKAIEIFKQIKNPDAISYIFLLNACAQLRTDEARSLIQLIQKEIPEHFYSNINLVTSLVDALAKCGDIVSAEAIFNGSTRKNMDMYAALMKGYIINNQSEKVIQLFEDITDPNAVLYTVLFGACAQLGNRQALDTAQNARKEIPPSFYSDKKLVTSLVDALAKCGDLASTQAVFDSATNKNVQMYNAFMKGCLINDQPKRVIELFNEIKTPDVVSYILLCNACAQIGSIEELNLIKEKLKHLPQSFYSHPRFLTTLADLFVKCDDFSSAQTLFNESKIKTAEMFAVMMNGFNREDEPEKTIQFFQQMKSNGIEGNSAVYLSLIKALARLSDQSLSQSMTEQIPEKIFSTQQIQTALLDLWGRSGSIEKAKEYFQNLSEPQEYGYTAMINAYGLNGMGNQALELYQEMPPQFISEITHICILNACSHAGLVKEAQLIFENIPTKSKRIYNTIIDCLSRASLFEQAQHLVQQYEHEHPPSLVMYMALLSGARNEKNTPLAQHIHDRMKNLFPQSKDVIASGSTLLANIYAATGDVEKAADLQQQIRHSGVKKKIGLSWTVTSGHIYRFKAHDQSHPRSAEIYAEVEAISKELVRHGHQYDSSWITRPLDADETVASVLCGHSERLAIAWNFVVNPNASRIQVTKNLRVCGDCHRATKLIAAIRQCDIIVRDANRIHHFHKNGQCSCNDYF